jgi:hypothetical protein
MTGVEELLSLIKLRPRHFAVIALLGTLILFLPETIATKFGLDLIPPVWRFTIGLATLASYAGIIIHLIIKIGEGRSAHKKKMEYQNTVLARLSALSKHEGSILKKCFDDKQQTITVHILAPAHPYAGALCTKGLLSQSWGSPGTYVTTTNEIPYTIPDFVWNSPEFSLIFSPEEAR